MSWIFARDTGGGRMRPPRPPWHPRSAAAARLTYFLVAVIFFLITLAVVTPARGHGEAWRAERAHAPVCAWPAWS